jgi:hypothetical protein
MITRPADRDKPIYLAKAHFLNVELNTLATGLDPNKTHVLFVVDKMSQL